jgi:hypothetical protein
MNGEVNEGWGYRIMNSKSPSEGPIKWELESVSRILRESLESLSEEEVQVQLKLLRKIKKSYRLDLESINLVLEVGRKGGCEIVYPLLYGLVGKERLDEWLKKPAVAKQKIKETKDRIAEVEQLISLLKAKLGSPWPNAR